MLVTPAITALIKFLFRIAGLEPPEDPEEDMYNFIEGTFGEGAEHLSRFGLAGVVGVDLRGSLRPRVEIPETSWDLLGAPGGSLKDVYEGLSYLANGDQLKGFEKLSPRVLSGKIKAIREYSQGITTQGNAPVMYEDKQLRPDAYDTAVRFLSGNPTGISGPREELYKQSQLEKKYAKKRAAIYTRIRKWVLDGRPAYKWKSLEKDIQQYNKLVESRELDVSLISDATLKRILKGADPEGPEATRNFRRSGRDRGW